MIEKIKNNFLVIILTIFLLISGLVAIYQYKKDDNDSSTREKHFYEECKNGKDDPILCSKYQEPLKNMDTVNTFGYITQIYNSISGLQLLAPLLIMIVAIWDFYKKLKNGYIKNSITRIPYKKSIKNLYFNALKYSLVMPIFLLLIFGISYIISGNFDYKYSIEHYGFDAFGIINIQNWIIFLVVYLFNFILHGIFWINIIIYNAKHNKNVLITIVVSYVEYLMIFIIFELIFGGVFFADTELFSYFSLSNIWAYSNVTIFGMTIVSLLLAIISTLLIYMTYKDRENVLGEI